MDSETLGRTLGWAGGLLGGAIGILGGALGTYLSIRNTRGPRERAFVMRASIACWVGVGAFGVGMWLLPLPYKYGLIGLFVFGLLLGVRRWNERQAAIRAEESRPAAGPTEGQEFRPIHGSE